MWPSAARIAHIPRTVKIFERIIISQPLPGLGQVEPTRAPQNIGVNQDIEQTLDNRLSILPVALDAIWIGQCQHGEALRGIALTNRHF
jgi:hypothetical protein